jgi:hypothetical protein
MTTTIRQALQDIAIGVAAACLVMLVSAAVVAAITWTLL